VTLKVWSFEPPASASANVVTDESASAALNFQLVMSAV
jgi:hypothetical protein